MLSSKSPRLSWFMEVVRPQGESASPCSAAVPAAVVWRALRVCDFFPDCHPEHREAQPNGVEGPHTRWQRRWLRDLFTTPLPKNLSTVVASQADLGCLDSTAACAALALSMTEVEKINKVTHSERSRRAPPTPLGRRDGVATLILVRSALELAGTSVCAPLSRKCCESCPDTPSIGTACPP